MLIRECCGRSPRAHLELGEDVGEVPRHSLFGPGQLLANGRIAEAGTDEPEDFDLAWTQAVGYETMLGM
jgi:hypothetical protein